MRNAPRNPGEVSISSARNQVEWAHTPRIADDSEHHDKNHHHPGFYPAPRPSEVSQRLHTATAKMDQRDHLRRRKRTSMTT